MCASGESLLNVIIARILFRMMTSMNLKMQCSKLPLKIDDIVKIVMLKISKDLMYLMIKYFIKLFLKKRQKSLINKTKS